MMHIEAAFKALADPTRVRILRLLSKMELSVGELAQVLEQSQPRVSRHVGILCEAGLSERRREGSWVFLHMPRSLHSDCFLHSMSQMLAIAEHEDRLFADQCQADRQKLADIRSSREKLAQAYFERHARDWDELRKRHSSDQKVESALIEALGSEDLGDLLDIGTGTGRIAQLLADQSNSVVAFDKSLEMLKLARARLHHLPAEKTEIVCGDFNDLPFEQANFDTVVLHQVLHFAQDPELVLEQAARVTRPKGRIVIVDFAAHSHEEFRDLYAHSRLGFYDHQIEQIFNFVGFTYLPPIELEGKELVVKIWIGKRENYQFKEKKQRFAKI